MKKILKAANVADAEEAVKAIKTFDEAEWDKVGARGSRKIFRALLSLPMYGIILCKFVIN